MGFLSRLFGTTPKPVTVLRTGENRFAPTARVEIKAREIPQYVAPRRHATSIRVTTDLTRAALDSDGQPALHHYNSWRRNERSVHELIGLLKGIIANGSVTEDGLAAVIRWVAANAEAEQSWPVDEVCIFTNEIASAGRIRQSDCQRAFVLFTRLVQPRNVAIGDNPSTALPLTQPQPSITFKGMVYVLTGKFDLGPRAACEREITERGGICAHDVTYKTDVVVIGSSGSRDWIETAYGRKIQSAMEHNAGGANIAIVSEEHWAGFL